MGNFLGKGPSATDDSQENEWGLRDELIRLNDMPFSTLDHFQDADHEECAIDNSQAGWYVTLASSSKKADLFQSLTCTHSHMLPIVHFEGTTRPNSASW